MLLELLKEVISIGASLPCSFYETKRKLCSSGVGYKIIHASKYNCILYWKNFVLTLPNMWWYMIDDDKEERIPHNVLRHFPLIPKLRWLSASNNMLLICDVMERSEFKWIYVKTSNKYRRLEAFWSWICSVFLKPRNVCLGLALDEFNLFGNMSTSYSSMLVVIFPYNLSPWKCMKLTNFFITLLIPEPKSPWKEIDVYLQPLVKKLNILWNNDVQTYESFTSTNSLH